MFPDKMIELVMAGEETDDFSQELYAAFRNGLPIERLRPLLISSHPQIVHLGSYLVYELGPLVRGLLNDIVKLLDSEHAQVRSDALRGVFHCATQFDGVALGKAFCLLDDPEPFVQRSAVRFVQMCEATQLYVAINNGAETNRGTVFEQLPKFFGDNNFFSSYVAVSYETLTGLMSHENEIAKRLAVGLAARPRPILDEKFLELAYSFENEMCREFVELIRKHPIPRGAILRKIEHG